ncbi:hypothetical protein [Vibrio phage BUCT006]|nr:hypothetical protein [Vibrio phage BUCT006]
MTTIAYCHRDKEIAWDSRQTGDGGIIKNDSAQKHYEIEGVGYWISGVVSDESLMIEAYQTGKVSRVPECNAFVFDGGRMYRCGVDAEGFLWKEELKNNDSFGSGHPFALSAMRLGMSAKDAVKHAKKLDCYTGGKVYSMKLKSK